MPENNSTGGKRWTPERDAQLKGFLRIGVSASRIAREMGGGITRNAVIGRAHRIKAKFAHGEPPMLRDSDKTRRKSESVAEEKPAAAPAGSKVRRNFTFKKTVSHKEHINDEGNKPSLGLLGDGALWAGKGISLYQLRDHQCRWPFDGKDRFGSPLCCGDHVAGAGVPYCPQHFRIAFVQTVRRATGKASA